MEVIRQAYLKGERALFNSNHVKVVDSVFYDGESPLKESKNIEINQSIFKWKYPLWYCENVMMNNSTLLETARSGIWYTKNIDIQNSTIEAPKTFRKSQNIRLLNVDMPIALESFWDCENIELSHVSAKGDYFGLKSEDVRINDLRLTGNYCFDSGKNIEVHNSKLISKDAFWNCEDVTVYNSLIVGEYLGWNSKNLTFVNCTIESLQGLCYIENLKLVNCKLINTSLAFEYSTVNAEVTSHIDSIINPISGVIKADSIGEVILDKAKINPKDTEIIINNKIDLNEDYRSCV